MNAITLTEQLVSIPSYLGSGCDEQKIGEFIFDYLKKFSWLKVVKQSVCDGRFNIIVTDNYPTKLLICGHIDTVEPKGKFVKPVIKDDKLYGLGSSDMKCTIACMLETITRVKTKGVMWLFYVDEEYDFLGMEKFIKEYKSKIKSELIIGEGSDNQVRNGCRGLIEIKFCVTGKTGHASRPENGNNAIIGSQKIFNELEIEVAKYTDKFVGGSSINLASINGGLKLGPGQIGRQGNNIADYCEFIIDVRTATNKLRAEVLIKKAQKIALKNKLVLESFVRHDKFGWFSPFEKLPKSITKKYELWSDFRSGYVDTQMLNETFKCPCYGFGCGQGDQAHKANEFVPLKSLITSENFFIDLIRNLEGGEN